ncbi:MAG: FAD-dependent oxidoreductase [Proteobacteria bacterium]|nr:FAD-dependent oxidoreductase [Pseudomonadota bacterium]
MHKFDVIIIGGGAVGTSALFHLAKGGAKKALLLEKLGDFGRGATGVWGSLVRMFHFNAETTAAAASCVPFYVNFEDRVGEPFQWNKSGSLYFLKKRDLPKFAQHLEALKHSKLEFHVIDAVQGRRDFHNFAWYEDDVAIYEPNAGVANPSATTRAFVTAACRYGATAKLDANVTEIVKEKGRVQGVRTHDGEYYECDQLVVCSGIWTNQILAPLAVQVPAFLKTIQLNRFCKRHDYPVHPFFVDLAELTFGQPSEEGSFVGGHLGVDLETGSRSVEPVSLEYAGRAKQRLSLRMPWIKTATLEGGIKALENYTSSTVGFVMRLPEFENVIVSTGWSCAGFTLAPAIGERIAKVASQF